MKNDPVVIAEVIEVIAVTHRMGEGTDADPIRFVRRYHARDGKLLAIHDEWLETFDGKQQRAMAIIASVREKKLRKNIDQVSELLLTIRTRRPDGTHKLQSEIDAEDIAFRNAVTELIRVLETMEKP